MNNFRAINMSCLLICIALLTIAIYVETTFRLAPCPLCMLQRFVYISIIVILAIASIHNPKNRLRKNVYCLVTLVFSGMGIFLAGRQSWLQHIPADKNATCLPGLKFLFQSMPLGQAIKTILHGSQECGTVRWVFIHLSMAEWSLIFFVLLAVVMFIMLFINRDSQHKHLES